MRYVMLALTGLALAACVHSETVRREPASTTVVTPAPEHTTTVVRPGAY
jgi:hypothetical protein